MLDRAAALALKERLPRAWPAFFERHGRFTPTQLAAMPVLLDGHNAIVCAPTASGKTEAALAPLVERYCHHDSPTPAVLYLVPTRALVGDLAARLAPPLETLRLSLGVRTRDGNNLGPSRRPAVVLTTPESLDSLLATRARFFARLRAVVVDELHLLDGTPRGDQLRVLLNRLRAVRAHAHASGEAPDAALQCVGLSATLPAPQEVAARYWPAAQVVRIGGGRALDTTLVALSQLGGAELLETLRGFRARGWRKALAFCNSRADVEAYASAVRGHTPFGDAVFVHYSNIEARRRQEIERQFAGADAALCFASSTLELGIDIGSIDVVLLIGPPGGVASFLQRLGRGNRRGQVTRVVCFYRTPLERLLFEALCAPEGWTSPTPMAAPFHPAVAIQQIFSLLKQSPTGAVRLAALAPLFEGMLTPADLQAILVQLQAWDYLTAGRPGEWRSGDRLNTLIDLQGSPRATFSLHSNIEGSVGGTVAVRDSHSQRTVAHVDAQWLERPLLTLEGRPITVEWSDGEALWVSAYQGQDRAAGLPYRSARQLLSPDLAGQLPARLGLSVGTAPIIAAQDPDLLGGWWLFHWLGDLYGRALLDLLRERVSARPTAQPGLCVGLADEPRALPPLTEAHVRHYLHEHYRALEPLLALGPYYTLLPAAVRRRSVLEQFNVPRFLEAITALRPVTAPESLSSDLAALLAPPD